MSPVPRPFLGDMLHSQQPSASSIPFSKFMNFCVPKYDLSGKTSDYGKLEIKMM